MSPSLWLHSIHVFPQQGDSSVAILTGSFLGEFSSYVWRVTECTLGLYHLHFILREVYLRQIKYLFYERKLRKWSVRASRASFNWTTVEFRYSFQIFSYCWIYYTILQKKKLL